MERTDEEYLLRAVRRLFAEKLISDSNYGRQILNSDLAKRANLQMPSGQFALLLLDVIDYMPEENRMGGKAPDEVDSELNFAVGAVFEEMLAPQYEGMMFQHSGEAFLLLSLRDPLPELTKPACEARLRQLRETCQTCLDRAQEQFGIRVRVYVSTITDDVSRLQHMKELLIRDLDADAPARLGKKVVTPLELNDTLRMSDRATRSESQFLQRRILEFADKRLFREAADMAIRLIRHDWEHYVMVVSLRERLTSIVHQVFAWLEFPFIDGGLHEDNVASQLRRALTRDDLEDCMLSMFDEFEAHYTPKATRRIERVEEILRYIEENYSDPMLNATSVSDHFGIRLSYLSQLFREAQGVKLIDYIHNMRVQHAKQILSANTDTIDAVARQVGYLNSLTFTRAFKRCTGVTPGVYRSMI